MALTRTPIDPSASEPAMPVSPEKSEPPPTASAPSPNTIARIRYVTRQRFFSKITISMSGSPASIKSGLHLGASNLFGSYRTTMYVIEPSILLNQCGTPAGMTTTSPVFMCCVTPP